jgi:hypothetical protein
LVFNIHTFYVSFNFSKVAHYDVQRVRIIAVLIRGLGCH